MRCLLFFCIVSVCVRASTFDFSKTLLEQSTCSISGAYQNNGIFLEWDNVNSSGEESYCALTMNPYGDERFIRFVFKERPVFLRFFFLKRKIFSHKKESFFRENTELSLWETTGEKPVLLKVCPSGDGEHITWEQLNDSFSEDFFDDFSEFVLFAKKPEAFLEMFEKSPLLYFVDGDRTSIFFMPKARELAMFAGDQKRKKDATMYFSPPGQNDFLIWKVSFINNQLTILEYSSKEDLFWVDKDGDGVPEFCLRKQQNAWLKFPCLKKVVLDDEASQ